MKIKLDDIEKKHPFIVDKSYFEQLGDRISKRTVAGNRQSSFSTFGYPKLAFAIAVLTIAVSSVMYTIELHNDNSYDEVISELTHEEILQYLEFQEVSEDELASLLPIESQTFELDLKEIDFDLEDDELINEIYNLSDQI